MIVGVGVDTVPVERIRRLLEKFGDRFVRRVYTEQEREYALSRPRRAAEILAGRFGVKEAVMKVLGTGKSSGVLWRDVETVRGEKGKPEVRLHGRARELAETLGITDVHVSITHDGGMAVAFVVAEDRREVTR
ncbi:MAG: holo-ACP synthase [Deltaproteobacteria bacterium]|nr:MAG: holo-ACP synthase [Deltaproteobacteria bacterium]